MPETRADRIRAWKAVNEDNAMMGNAVKDAPVLATVELTMAKRGRSAVVGQTSDVVPKRRNPTLVGAHGPKPLNARRDLAKPV